LPIILHERECCSLIIKEELRPMVLECSVLRRNFGPKRNEMMGGWRKLHKEELCDVHSSTSIIRIIMSRRMKLVGHLT
jgi:hypothetical protein